MKISVSVKAGRKEDRVEKLSNGSFSVWVKEKPQDGKANYAIREALAEYFKVPKSRVVLLSGAASKMKLFDIT